MPQLTKEQKTFVVTRLARFDAPADVREELRERYGIDVPPSHLARYNPENAAAKELGAKWRTLFERTREEFLGAAAPVPGAHKAVRVKELWEMARRARQRGSFRLAAQLLEQIAKEMGGAYTNRHAVEVNATGRRLGEAAAALADSMEPAELAALYFERIRGGEAPEV